MNVVVEWRIEKNIKKEELSLLDALFLPYSFENCENLFIIFYHK